VDALGRLGQVARLILPKGQDPTRNEECGSRGGVRRSPTTRFKFLVGIGPQPAQVAFAAGSRVPKTGFGRKSSPRPPDWTRLGSRCGSADHQKKGVGAMRRATSPDGGESQKTSRWRFSRNKAAGSALRAWHKQVIVLPG